MLNGQTGRWSDWVASQRWPSQDTGTAGQSDSNHGMETLSTRSDASISTGSGGVGRCSY